MAGERVRVKLHDKLKQNVMISELNLYDHF